MQLDTIAVLRHGLDAHHNFALVGELDRVIAQIDEDLAEPQWIAPQGRWHIRRRTEQQLQALVLGFEAHQIGQVVHHIFQVEVDGFHAHLAGFDLGEIENVVDDAQQVFTGTVHLLDVVALLFIKIGLQRQVAHADDGVHGGADLMAHIGQEVALGFGSLLRNFTRAPQFSDVKEPGQCGSAALVFDMEVGRQCPERVAIKSLECDGPVDHVLAGSQAGQHIVERLCVLVERSRQDLRQLLGRDVQHVGIRLVGVENRAGTNICHPHSDRAGVQHGAHLTFAGLHPVFRQFLRRDVLIGPVHIENFAGGFVANKLAPGFYPDDVSIGRAFVGVCGFVLVIFAINGTLIPLCRHVCSVGVSLSQVDKPFGIEMVAPVFLHRVTENARRTIRLVVVIRIAIVYIPIAAARQLQRDVGKEVGTPDLRFHALAVGHILQHPDRALVHVRRVNGGTAELAPEAASIGTHHFLLALMRFTACKLFVCCATNIDIFILTGIPGARCLVEMGTVGVAKQFVELAVGANNDAIANEGDPQRCGLEHGALLGIGNAHGLLDFLAFGDIAHGRANTHASASQGLQPRQTHLYREQAAVLALALQRAVAATNVAWPPHREEIVPHGNVPTPGSHGYQQLDGLSDHLLLGIAEQVTHTRVDHLNSAALVHHDQPIRRRFDNAAVPRFRGGDRIFLRFHFDGLLLERGRLLLHGAGLALCLLQQFVGPYAALQNFHIHGQYRHGAIEQGLFARPEALQRCHLQHTQQTVVAQNRQYRDRARNRIPQTGADAHVICRRAAQYQG